MIKLSNQVNEKFITLEAVFEGQTISNNIEKSDRKTTLIDSHKTIFVYFKEKVLTAFELNEWMMNFASTNKRDLNIDVQSFVNSELNDVEALKTISEAVLFANHDVVNFKTTPRDKKVEYYLVSNIKNQEEIFTIVKAKMDSVNFTRDLQDTPPNIMIPERFAEDVMKKFDKIKNVTPTILDLDEIKKHEMGLLLSVASASHNEPRVVVLEYNGNPDSDEKIGLVGKGITFDTGGISLKPSNSMLEMKFDMSGAAIVCSTILALAKVEAKINVVAVAVVTENRIGGHATLVESVVKSMNGKTVEIQNTDAEGRLVLGDGITYAIRNKKATKIIDVATLTGAIVISLGHHATGAFSNNTDFFNEFEKATIDANERVWRLPIYQENVKEMQHSVIADLSNISKVREMGSSTAAAFLQEFVEEKPFIHLDIAGTANTKSRGTGVMVKSLFTFLNKN